MVLFKYIAVAIILVCIVSKLIHSSLFLSEMWNMASNNWTVLKKLDEISQDMGSETRSISMD